MKQQEKKVVIIGPESTGKSTLCEALANHYQTTWCAEYAREYLLEHGADYTYEDLVVIAKGQLSLEATTIDQAADLWQQQPVKSTPVPLVFVDTDMYVMKVWSEFVFGKVDPFILQKIDEQHTDLYLLCNIDLPWVQDELREYPDLERRQQLFDIYKKIMENQDVQWVLVEGPHEQRIATAIAAVDLFLSSLT
ncbi:AAA family ATPase [Aridibaculum aurantiacum]|uniref:AAA family ATPase n=1 Tax=Aridibaculum aurantiacum TaxID=2810307 RepID=UPI001A966CAA|nr:ATP-binding protein [Aridibaculum aurantiacum]